MPELKIKRVFLVFTSKGTTTTITIATTPTITTSHAPAGGPPILDIETANRVIENALNGSSCGLKANESFNSELISDHFDSCMESHSKELAINNSLKASEKERMNMNHNSTDEDSDEPESKRDKGDREEHSDTSPPPSKFVNSHYSLNVASTSARSSHSPKEPVPDDEKPLNLSSSTVLHTSNQHIIDHFIDKLLSSGSDGKKITKLI